MSENASHIRALREDRSHEFQTRMTHTPLQIYPKTGPTQNDLDRTLHFRDFFTKRQTRKLTDLNVDDCRLFCWKDCAVYRNTHDWRFSNQDLFAKVWPEWYAHRAMDKDLDDESFFMKYMVFNDPVGDLQEVVEFHETLCEKLHELEGLIPETKPENPFTANTRKKRDPPEVAEYRMRMTFDQVFVVLEDGWQDEGVLLVWKSREIVQSHGCRVGAGVQEYSGKLSVPDSGLVFQCSLKRAMQLVVSTNPDRAVNRAGFESGHLISIYGRDGSKPVDMMRGEQLEEFLV